MNTLMVIKIENKKIETIRVNEKLALILEDVPKGKSYANWLLDKIEHLDAHEQNAICWVVSESDVGPNRMSVGDENGSNPIWDEIIYIVNSIPTTNMSHEEREEGWLGQTGDSSAYAHGGFASKEAARTYISEYMKGRLIDENLVKEKYGEYEGNTEIYTTEKYDYDKYYFAADYFEYDEPNVEGKSDEELEDLAEKLETEANKDGYCIVDDIERYLKELRDSN